MTIQWRRIFYVALIFWIWYCLPSFGASVVEVRITQTVGFAPLTMQAKIIVEPNTSNRSLCFIYDSGDYGSQSCWQLEGTKAPKVFFYTIKQLPKGVYGVRAILYRELGQVTSTLITITVKGDEIENE